MAGDITNGSPQISKGLATKTFVDNLKHAARECCKVIKEQTTQLALWSQLY